MGAQIHIWNPRIVLRFQQNILGSKVKQSFHSKLKVQAILLPNTGPGISSEVETLSFPTLNIV
ncbi:hypothetical protein TNCV_3930561, partial [Trichonephila clavipes]